MNGDVKGNTIIGCLGTLLLGFVLAVCLGGRYGCAHVQQSEGFRDGTVRKVSETGVIFKTTEVEMVGATTDVNVMTAGTFGYSVTDPAVVQKLQSLPPGKKVRLHYRKMLTTWPTRGETAFFITRVEEL